MMTTTWTKICAALGAFVLTTLLALATPAHAIETGTLNAKGLANVVVAVSNDALDELIKEANAEGDEGIVRVIMEGHAYIVPRGTPVRVLGHTGFLSSKIEIRIMGGANRGRIGFVPSEFVTR
jgi:hypothetical protein